MNLRTLELVQVSRWRLPARTISFLLILACAAPAADQIQPNSIRTAATGEGTQATKTTIVNSERGGHESDKRFYDETLQMVDAYRKAGGNPTRWFVQSWYPHPKQMTPESEKHSMTALVKSVIERVRSDKPDQAE